MSHLCMHVCHTYFRILFSYIKGVVISYVNLGGQGGTDPPMAIVSESGLFPPSTMEI